MYNSNSVSQHSEYIEVINKITDLIADYSDNIAQGLKDYIYAINEIYHGNYNPDFKHFTGMFGRATTYVSLTKIPEFLHKINYED